MPLKFKGDIQSQSKVRVRKPKKSNMVARRPFWKWHRWKSIGFCLWPPSTCIWNLKLKFQSKLDLCFGNHVVYRQTDKRTDKVNPVYPPSNFVGRGYNEWRFFYVLLVLLILVSLRPTICPSICGPNHVRSVSYKTLFRFISQLPSLSTNFWRCVVFFIEIPKFEVLLPFLFPDIANHVLASGYGKYEMFFFTLFHFLYRITLWEKVCCL